MTRGSIHISRTETRMAGSIAFKERLQLGKKLILSLDICSKPVVLDSVAPKKHLSSVLRPAFGCDLYETKCSPGFIGHENSDRMFPPSGRKGQMEVRGTILDIR